jgi:RimJ/RimL family protein N-acetyltransferase
MTNNYMIMKFNIQKILENDEIILLPLVESDFDNLYSVASDPAIWAQHPLKDRWKKDEFKNFFKGAISSSGAFKIVQKNSRQIIGSTRFYDYSEEEQLIFIGYTFYAVEFWGSGINPAVKKLMLNYVFQFVKKVCFHIGAVNLRSQIAIGRLGAVKVNEQIVSYLGEAPKLNYVFEIRKENWLS